MLKHIIVIWFLLLPGFYTFSQEYQATPVEKSTEKVILGGKKYYVHTVKKGQTMYSVCKAYGVTENELLQANGLTTNTLKEGQVLKIPVIEVSTLKYDEKGYIKHQIITGETLYSLSTRYNMDAERIVECNPGIQTSLNTGQLVYIPRKYINTHSITQTGSDYKTIVVKESETLYSISKLYNVTVDEIKAANPELNNGVIKVGQQLKIPVKPELVTEYIISGNVVTVASLSDTTSTDSSQFQDPYPACSNEKYHGQVFTIAVMLPFEARVEQSMVNQNNMDPETSITISSDEPDTEEKPSEKFLYRKNFMEFYEGILLAVDSLKSRGIKIKMLVYDTKNDPNTVRTIVNSNDFQDVNLIIGPVFPDEIKIVNEFSKNKKVPVVSPLSNNIKMVADNPFLFQVIPSDENQVNAIAAYIASNKEARVVFIHNEDTTNIKVTEHYKTLLFNHWFQNGNKDSMDFSNILYSGSRWDEINNIMAKDKPNIVFMPSADEAYISKTISKLYLMSDRYDIQLIGFPDWQFSKSLDLNYLHLMQLQIVTPFFVDYNDMDVQRFLYHYREAYKTEPFSLSAKGFTYGMLGYDISFYFINALFTYGKDFIGCIENYQCSSLETNFKYSKNSMISGFDNRSFQVIQYTKEYEIKLRE